MEIILTIEQWEHLKKIVTQGRRSENMLSRPIEISNVNISIEIKADGVKIILPN